LIDRHENKVGSQWLGNSGCSRVGSRRTRWFAGSLNGTAAGESFARCYKRTVELQPPRDSHRTNRLRYFCGKDTGDLVKAQRELSEINF